MRRTRKVSPVLTDRDIFAAVDAAIDRLPPCKPSDSFTAEDYARHHGLDFQSASGILRNAARAGKLRTGRFGPSKAHARSWYALPEKK